jgi:hypothetical protein
MPSGRSSITSIRNGYLFSPFTVDMKVRPAKSRAKANGSVQIVSMPTGYLKICDSRSCGDFFTVPYASIRDEQTQSISCPLCRSRFPFSSIMPRDLMDPRRLLTERRIVINHAHLGYLEYRLASGVSPVGVLTRYETRIFLILTARHLKRQMAWTCGSYLSRFGPWSAIWARCGWLGR